jgi:hypothetical protein
VVWERTLDLAVRAVHVGSSGELFVHTLERDGPTQRGTLSRASTIAARLAGPFHERKSESRASPDPQC